VKAVVTGAAGFIGSHLTEALLARGHEVLGVDGFTDYYPRAIKEDNLSRARDHHRFLLVAGVRASWGLEFEAYTGHNILATQRLLEAAVGARTPRIVFASSSSVYGDSPVLPLREDSPCRPVSPYGVTKLAGEHLAHLYRRNHGLVVVSLRYFTVYGPRQRPDMAFHRFLRACRDGRGIHIYGDGSQTRDFTYVDDIVAATLAAADSGTPGAVYNVGGGERVALNEVLRKIEGITGQALRATREEAQRGDMHDTAADTTAAARDLAFRSAVPLDEGLSREWDWIRRLP